MIKLNLTSNEFIAILNELAKMIDMQPVSNEALHSKADIVRQYGHDEFVRLLDGLKNNELDEPAAWFQAIQYLYHNDKILFIPAPYSKELGIQSDEYDEIKNILTRLDIAFSRSTTINLWLLFLLVPYFILLFFVFYDLTWWKALLYTVGSFTTIGILMALTVPFVIKKIAVYYARSSFLKLFPKKQPNHHTAIKILENLQGSYQELQSHRIASIQTLKEKHRVTSAWQEPPNTKTKLSTQEKSVQKSLTKSNTTTEENSKEITFQPEKMVNKPAEECHTTTKSNTSTEQPQDKVAQKSLTESNTITNQSLVYLQIYIEVLNPFLEANKRRDSLLGFLVLLSPIAILLELLVLYDLAWWKYIVYDLGISLLIAGFILTIDSIYERKELESAKTRFLSVFPYDQQQYEIAIQIFKEIKTESKQVTQLIESIEKGRPRLHDEKNSEDKIKNRIHNIVTELSNKNDLMPTILSIMGIGVFVIILLTLFLYKIVWWKILISSIVGSLTFFFISIPIGMAFFYGKFFEEAKKSLLLLFPNKFQHYEKAIKILKEMSVSNKLANELLDSILREAQEDEVYEGQIGKKVKKIILSYRRYMLYQELFYIGIGNLSRMFIILYFLVFSELIWWKAILYLIGVNIISGFLIGIIFFLLSKKTNNVLANTFLSSFPMNHPNDYVALEMLIKVDLSGSIIAGSQIIKKTIPGSDSEISNLYKKRFGIVTGEISRKILGLTFKKSSYGKTFITDEDNWQNAHESLESLINFIQGLVNKGLYKYRYELTLVRFNLGSYLLRCNEFSLAIKQLEKTQDECQDLISERHIKRRELRVYLIVTRALIGTSLSGIGDLVVAKEVLEKSIEEIQTLRPRKNFNSLLIRLRVQLGTCLFSLNDISVAQELWEKAQTDCQVFIKKGDTSLRGILAQVNKLLGLCLQQSNSPAAQSTLEKSVDEFQKLIDEGQPKFRPQLLSAKMALGDYYASCTEFATAREIYETGVKEYQALIAEGHDELNKELNAVYISLGKCLQALGEFSEADNRYEKALDGLMELSGKGQIFSDEIRKVITIIQWHNSSQRPGGQYVSKAFKTALIGLEWLNRVLNQVSDTSKSDLVEKNIYLYRVAADFALQLKQPGEAYLFLERSKSRVLVEQMLRERAEPGLHVDEKLRTQYRELRERLRLLVNQLDTSAPTGIAGDGTTRFFTPTTRSIEHRPEQTEQLLQEQQAVEQELKKVRDAIAEPDQDPAFGEAIQPHALTVEEVIALIPADTLVIAFEQRPEFLYLYAITAQGIQTPLKVNLSLQQVQAGIEEFEKGITKEHSTDREEALDEFRKQWLDQHLKQPVSELIAQSKPNHIILIPHIGWHLLPIHLVSINDEPLAVRYSVRYLPSLQILRLISERPLANQGKGCIIANPWSPALEKLIGKKHELKSGEKEGYKVYELRAQVDTLLAREQATSTEVRKALDKAQHSHFSCHGHFDADLTKAGLTLADCKDLAAIEMFTSIRLDNPRLVVMSACETAQIKPTLADEYMGLSSSFLFAGAHNVLATLWRVDDNASRLLIENFYQGLNEGLSPVNALQKAQRHLRKMTIEELYERLKVPIADDFENPYYWAGFILIGDGK